MLTIEKNSENISLFYKERIRLWSPLFFRALALALGLHLLGILFFQIDLGLLPIKTTLLPSVKVSSQAPAIETLIEINQAVTVAPYLQVKREAFPQLSLMPLHPIEIPSPQIIFPSSDSLTATSNQTTYAHIQFSGPDMAYNLFRNDWKVPRETKALLQFKAIMPQGYIVWLNWEQSTGDLQLDHDIETYLKSLSLKEMKDRMIVEGIVEVEFKNLSN